MPKCKIKVRNAVSDFLKRWRIVDKTIKVCYKKDKGGVNFSFNNMAANTAYCVRIAFKLNSADKISSLLLKWVQDGIDACWIRDDSMSGVQTANATLVKDAKTGVYVWTSYLTAGDQGKQLAFYNVGGQSYNIGSIEVFEVVPETSAE